MTDSEIKELKELAKNATPGPWGIDVCRDDRGNRDLWRAETPIVPSQDAATHDAHYIVACSPERIIAICEQLERLALEINRLAHESDLRASERDKMEKSVESLRAKLEKAIEALEWYSKWDWTDKYVQAVPKRARETLRELES